jgi:hypothetical protein
MFCVLRCIMTHWVETPSTPPFIYKGVGFTEKDCVGYSCIQLGLYLYLPILQDLSNDFLLNRLSYGPPGPDPYSEWADS